ncbi:MAG: hypothetical protein ACMZ7B_11985 [Balneola sp.]
MSETSIQENLNEIKTRIQAACERSGRNSEEITLIAVSKTKPNEAIIDAFTAGQLHFGETECRNFRIKWKALSCRGFSGT